MSEKRELVIHPATITGVNFRVQVLPESLHYQRLVLTKRIFLPEKEYKVICCVLIC